MNVKPKTDLRDNSRFFYVILKTRRPTYHALSTTLAHLTLSILFSKLPTHGE